jgi:hypothetical protein
MQLILYLQSRHILARARGTSCVSRDIRPARGDIGRVPVLSACLGQKCGR